MRCSDEEECDEDLFCLWGQDSVGAAEKRLGGGITGFGTSYLRAIQLRCLRSSSRQGSLELVGLPDYWAASGTGHTLSRLNSARASRFALTKVVSRHRFGCNERGKVNENKQHLETQFHSHNNASSLARKRRTIRQPEVGHSGLSSARWRALVRLRSAPTSVCRCCCRRGCCCVQQ